MKRKKMSEIHVLPKQIAELIAAGEVIERPASVIKELVENAIDAGAKKIVVEIQHGGITYMRVSDDGKGILREDVRNAFLRHATSKIYQSDDLDKIATLGFRGEALASICAVSRMEILTKSRQEKTGVRMMLEGGEERSFQTAGCPDGTTMIVRDLFYNVPARMKFLKKDVSEGNSVSSLMDRMALSHPDISFTFIRDGRQALKTPGDNQIENAVMLVYGEEFSDSLLKIQYELGGMRIYGFVTKPQLSLRANRSMQLFFINGRYVRTKTAMAAVEQAYKGYITVGKFPSCTLYLEMDCSSLDVNVHPAKLEVRFANERPVYDLVYHAVRSALLDYDTRKSEENKLPVPQYTNPKLLSQRADRGVQLSFAYGNPQKNIQISENSRPIAFSVPKEEKEPEIISSFVKEERQEPEILPEPVRERQEPEILPEPVRERQEPEILPESAREVQEPEITPVLVEENQEEVKIIDEDQRDVPLKYIGEAFRTYIIIEYGENRLMFIDKHAAHERLIYERLKKQHKVSAPQMLLEPIVMTLDREEVLAVMENQEILMEAGFEAEEFGDGKIILRSVPLMMETVEITEAFQEIADHLYKHKKLIPSEKMEWIYANTACRAAIKGGNLSHPEELIELAVTLEKNPEIRTCPHGRPIYFFMTKNELEKNFKRIF